MDRAERVGLERWVRKHSSKLRCLCDHQSPPVALRHLHAALAVRPGLHIELDTERRLAVLGE